MKIIVLAGGRGTRLWPMSRELYSKQFMRLPGSSESLLTSAYVRAQALVQPEDIITVTSQDFAFFVNDTFQEVIGKVPSMERVKDLHRSDVAGDSPGGPLQ